MRFAHLLAGSMRARSVAKPEELPMATNTSIGKPEEEFEVVPCPIQLPEPAPAPVQVPA